MLFCVNEKGLFFWMRLSVNWKIESPHMGKPYLVADGDRTRVWHSTHNKNSPPVRLSIRILGFVFGFALGWILSKLKQFFLGLQSLNILTDVTLSAHSRILSLIVPQLLGSIMLLSFILASCICESEVGHSVYQMFSLLIRGLGSTRGTSGLFF